MSARPPYKLKTMGTVWKTLILRKIRVVLKWVYRPYQLLQRFEKFTVKLNYQQKSFKREVSLLQDIEGNYLLSVALDLW